MSLRYSPSMGGFYETGLHSEMPDDAVYVRPAYYAELMDQQSAGAQIKSSPETGRPIAVLPSSDERRAALIHAAKAEPSRRILRISPLWRQINDLRETSAGAIDRFAAIDAVRDISATIE